MKTVREFVNESGKKVKVLCEHCGKKRTVKEINYSIDDVHCPFCKKEGALVYI